MQDDADDEKENINCLSTAQTVRQFVSTFLFFSAFLSCSLQKFQTTRIKFDLPDRKITENLSETGSSKMKTKKKK